jgi:hypothetical protein
MKVLALDTTTSLVIGDITQVQALGQIESILSRESALFQHNRAAGEGLDDRFGPSLRMCHVGKMFREPISGVVSIKHEPLPGQY